MPGYLYSLYNFIFITLQDLNYYGYITDKEKLIEAQKF